MARIPTAADAGLGEQIARGPRFNETQIPRSAFGGGIGESMQRAGQQMQQADEQERREQMMEQRQAMAVREAEQRSKALARLKMGQDDLLQAADEVGQGIASGQIAKEGAAQAWRDRVNEVTTATLADTPEDHRQAVQLDMAARANRLDRAVGQAVLKRGQADTRANIGQILESTGRQYMTDPQGAESLALTTLRDLGPVAGMAPDEIAKTGQRWQETTRAAKGYSLITEARRDNKSLDVAISRINSDEFAALDPQRKAEILNQAEGFRVSNIQRSEAAARAAQARHEHMLRTAEAAYNAAAGIVQTGKMLSPEYIQQLTTATAGTPFAQALPDLLKQAPERSAFGMQPLQQMDRAIMDERARLNTGGTNPADEKRMQQLERIRDEARKDYAEDPLPAAQARGLLGQITPLDTRSVQGLVSGLGERLQQAALVSQQTGRAESPLLKTEAEQLGKTLSILPVPERAAAVATLAGALGPQMAAALGRQMSPKDEALGLALAMSGEKTSQGRYTSELVLRGQQAKKDGTSTKGSKQPEMVASKWGAAVAEYIGDSMPQGVGDQVRNAAVLIAHGIASEQGGELSSKDLARAARLAVGGEVIEYNGRKVPLPAGLDEDALTKRMRSVTAADTGGDVLAGGRRMTAAEFAAVARDAPLMAVGKGQYAPLVQGRPVLRADGTPLVIGVR